MKNRNKHRATTDIASSNRRPSRVGAQVAFGLVLYTLACMVLVAPKTGQAGHLKYSGTQPIDTSFMDSGPKGPQTALVLNGGDSTVSVMDMATGIVTQTADLNVPANTSQALNWGSIAQLAYVGTSGGQILSVDPVTVNVQTIVNDTTMDFAAIAADDFAAGVLAYATNDKAATLVEVQSGGGVVTKGPIPFASGSNEVKEMEVELGAPAPLDSMVLASGKGSTWVYAYDRDTGIDYDSMYADPNVNPTGLATAPGGHAFVTVVETGGGAGALLRVNVNPLAFGFFGAPIATYPAGEPLDVSVAGDFITVLTAVPGVTGLDPEINVYDFGDPGNILYAGRINLGHHQIQPYGGLSTGIDAGGTIDGLTYIHANYGTSVSTERLTEDRGEFLDQDPGGFGGGCWPITTPGESGALSYSPAPCTDCPPEDAVARGAVDGPSPSTSSGQSVHFATGEEVKVFPLLSVPGVGLDLDITLTYRSRRDYDYRYGQGWFMNHDARIKAEANGDQTYTDGYGHLDTYLLQPGGAFIPPVHYDTTLNTGATTTVTNRFGTVSTFDGQGYRTSITDRYQNQISYTWVSDQLIAITDTLGRNYTLSYDSNGRLSSIADFGGRVWSMSYDYMGQLRSVTTPSSAQFPTGRTHWFSYSPNNPMPKLRHNLVHTTSPKGDVVQTLSYNAHDMVTAESIGPGTMTFSYDIPTWTTTVVDAENNTTKWSFDQIGMPVKRQEMTRGVRPSEPTAYVTDYTIGSNGFISHTVYPRGNRTDYTYDSALNLTEVRHRTQNTSTNDASDIVWGYQYAPPYNQRIQMTDPRGNLTNYIVDARGNTVQIDRPTVTSPATQSISELRTFDAQGRILSATDGEGRRTDFTYHTTGAQAGYLKDVIRDATTLALTTTFGYDQYGNVTSVKDPNGNTTTLTVDAEDYVTQIQAPTPLNYKRKITYDENRNIEIVEVENVDRKGALDPTTPWIATTLSYNDVDWLISASRKLTATTTATTNYEYTASGLLEKVTQPEGNESTLEYDERRRLFKATRGPGTADKATVKYDYDLNGSLSKFTDGRGNATSFQYDLFDRRTRTTDPLGHYVQSAYDKSSNRTSSSAYDVTNTLMAKTTRHFDEIDRLWKLVRDRFGPGVPSSTPTTTITHDRGHLVTQVTDPLSNATSFTYDLAGRFLTDTDAAGNKQTYTYDANGNVTKISDTQVPASGPSETFVTEFAYDQLNRRTATKEIDRLNASNILTTTFEYDSRSNLTFRTDAEGNPVRWTYDLASRLTKYERALQVGAQIDAFVQSIDESFAYDGNSRLVTVTDDNFNATTYQYDALSRRTRTTHADSKYITWTHDDNGNVSGWTDQNGSVVANTHDALNRLTSRTINRGTGVLGSTLETYTYDALGRLTATTDNDYQVEFTHDSVGNVTQERQGYIPTGQEKWKHVLSTYDDAGAASALTYPTGFGLQHVRDSIHRLTAIHDIAAQANVATFSWQGASRLAQTNNQNGTVTEYTYDGFRNTQTIDHLLGGGGSLHKFDYLYDKVHNRRMEKNSYSTSWTATLPAAVQAFLGGRNGKGDVYAYDMAYRLIDARYDVTNPAAEVGTPGSQAYASLTQYSLDGLGNRSQVLTSPPTPATTVTYAVDVVNQYTALGGATRSHDSNGNLTADGTHTFHYDYKNRLVELKNLATSATIATYKYDALGRRVEKAVVGGATTRYALDGHQVVEEYDGSDTWQALYIYEDGIDRPRVMDRHDIADVDGDSDTVETMRFHYHQNVLSSTFEMSDPGGAVVEWVTYDVYGKATIRDKSGTAIAQSAVGNPYLFTGREYDGESGKYFYRARMYDAASGRFLQRDPLGYVDGLGLHEYAGSNAATYVDPTGHKGKKPTLTLDGGSGKSGAQKLAKLKDAVKKVASLAGQVAEIKDAKEGNLATVTFDAAAKPPDHEVSPTAAATLDALKDVAEDHGSTDVGMPDKMPPKGKPWPDGTGDDKKEVKGNSQYGVSNQCALNPDDKYNAWELAWTLLHELLHVAVYHEAYDNAYGDYIEENETTDDVFNGPSPKLQADAHAHADEVARDTASDDTYDGGDTPENRPTWERTHKVKNDVGNKDWKKGPAKKKGN